MFFSEQPFYGNYSTLDSNTNTVISHAVAWSSIWLPKPRQGLLDCHVLALFCFQTRILSTFVSHQKGLVTCSRCFDYGDGAIRCEQQNTMRGWGRDFFPALWPSHLTPFWILAQATSQEAPQTFVSPFHPSLPQKLKVKKSIFEHKSTRLQRHLDFYSKKLTFSRKSRNTFCSVWLAQFVKS